MFLHACEKPFCKRSTRSENKEVSSLYALVFAEVVELAAVAIEHVYVHFGVYSAHAPVGTELPEHEVHIGFVLAVACYPHVVVALQVGGERQIAVHEGLADI